MLKNSTGMEKVPVGHFHRHFRRVWGVCFTFSV